MENSSLTPSSFAIRSMSFSQEGSPTLIETPAPTNKIALRRRIALASEPGPSEVGLRLTIRAHTAPRGAIVLRHNRLNRLRDRATIFIGAKRRNLVVSGKLGRELVKRETAGPGRLWFNAPRKGDYPRDRPSGLSDQLCADQRWLTIYAVNERNLAGSQPDRYDQANFVRHGSPPYISLHE
ncbi:hypothetical protein ACVWWD_006054 [Mesorhizobium sp. URHB0026]